MARLSSSFLLLLGVALVAVASVLVAAAESSSSAAPAAVASSSAVVPVVASSSSTGVSPPPVSDYSVEFIGSLTSCLDAPPAPNPADGGCFPVDLVYGGRMCTMSLWWVVSVSFEIVALDPLAPNSTWSFKETSHPNYNCNGTGTLVSSGVMPGPSSVGSWLNFTGPAIALLNSTGQAIGPNGKNISVSWNVAMRLNKTAPAPAVIVSSTGVAPIVVPSSSAAPVVAASSSTGSAPASVSSSTGSVVASSSTGGVAPTIASSTGVAPKFNVTSSTGSVVPRNATSSSSSTGSDAPVVVASSSTGGGAAPVYNLTVDTSATVCTVSRVATVCGVVSLAYNGSTCLNLSPQSPVSVRFVIGALTPLALGGQLDWSEDRFESRDCAGPASPLVSGTDAAPSTLGNVATYTLGPQKFLNESNGQPLLPNGANITLTFTIAMQLQLVPSVTPGGTTGGHGGDDDDGGHKLSKVAVAFIVIAVLAVVFGAAAYFYSANKKATAAASTDPLLAGGASYGKF